MNYCLQIVIYLAFIVPKTFEMSVSARIRGPGSTPSRWREYHACLYVHAPSHVSELFWLHGNGNTMATDRCQGEECQSYQHLLDISKYSLRADSSSGNLTIRNLSIEDDGRYQCRVATISERFSNRIELKVMLTGKLFPFILQCLVY